MTTPKNKARINADFDETLIEEVKDCVVFQQSGLGLRTNLRMFVDEALRKHLARLKSRFSRKLRGRPKAFPSRSAQLRRGRPREDQ